MPRQLSNQKSFYTFDDLLEIESRDETRYELIDGHLVPMTGGTKPHNLITSGLFSEIDKQKNDKCFLYISDVKLLIDNDTIFYPDVMLACDDGASDLYEENPLLLAEVLSDSSARKDRGIKLEQYFQLSSLYAYLILSQTEMMMTVYQKENKSGSWKENVLLGHETDVTIDLGDNHPAIKLNLGRIYKYLHSRS